MSLPTAIDVPGTWVRFPRTASHRHPPRPLLSSLTNSTRTGPRLLRSHSASPAHAAIRIRAVSDVDGPVSEGRRLEAVVLEVADLEKSEVLYREGFGLPLHSGDKQVEDRWIGGPHAEISWRDGAYLHFALYSAKERAGSGAQLTFAVDDIDEAHGAAVRCGARVIHEPRDEPWGRSGRYED